MSLAERFMSHVDVTPSCWLWTGATSAEGYGMFGPRGAASVTRAHRVAYELWNGPIPSGMHVDHMCHNRGCVNPSHLRAVTPQLNSQNRADQERGVHRLKSTGKWQAHVTCNGRKHHFGTHSTREEAVEAARKGRLLLFGEGAETFVTGG